MLSVRFMSVKGPFKELKRLEVANTAQMLYEVTEFYSKLGFSNFQILDEGDGDGGRVTARTPGGRGGRNVAFFDHNYQEESDG